MSMKVEPSNNGGSDVDQVKPLRGIKKVQYPPALSIKPLNVLSSNGNNLKKDSPQILILRRDVTPAGAFAFTQASFPPFSFSAPSAAVVKAPVAAITPSSSSSSSPVSVVALTSPINVVTSLTSATPSATVTPLTPVDYSSLLSAIAVTSTAAKSSTLTASAVNAIVSTTSISVGVQASADSANLGVAASSATTTAGVIQTQSTSTSNASNQSNSFSNTLTSSPLNIGLTSLVSFLILVTLGVIIFFSLRCFKKRKERRINNLNSSGTREGERDDDGILSTSEGDTYVGGGGSWNDGYKKSEKLDDLDVRWERQVREANYRNGRYSQDQDDWKVEQDNYNHGNYHQEEFNKPWDSPARAIVVKKNSPSSRKVVPQHHQENYHQFSTNPTILTPHPHHKPFLLSSALKPIRSSSPSNSSYPQQSQPIQSNRDPSNSAYLEHQVPTTTVFHDIDLGNPLATGSANNTSFNSPSPSDKNVPIWRTSLDRVLGAAVGFVVGKSANSDGILSPVMEERRSVGGTAGVRRNSIDSDLSLQRTLLEKPLKSPPLHQIPSLSTIVPPIPLPLTTQTRIPRQFFQPRIPVNRSILSPEANRSLTSTSELETDSPIVEEVQFAHRDNSVDDSSIAEEEQEEEEEEGEEEQVNKRNSLIVEPRWMMAPEEVAYSSNNKIIDDEDIFSDDKYIRSSIFIPSSTLLQSQHQQQELAFNKASSSFLENTSLSLTTPPFNNQPSPLLPSAFSPYLTFPSASYSHQRQQSQQHQYQPSLLRSSSSLNSIRTVTSVSSLNSNSVWDDINSSPNSVNNPNHPNQYSNNNQDMNGERSFSVPSPRGSIIFDHRNNGTITPTPNNTNNKSIEDLVEAEKERVKRMEAEMDRSKLLLDKTRRLALARNEGRH